MRVGGGGGMLPDMVDGARKRPLATAADLARLPGEVRAEVVEGEVVEKAAPAPDHADAQTGIVGYLRPPYQSTGGPGRPGGWWILAEVEIEVEAHEVYRPDVTGWRRDRVPERPRERPVRVRPDWVCEVLSPSNASRDQVVKFRTFERNAVPHYWIVDPERRTLTVYRWADGGYRVAVQAKDTETVRAEPFAEVEIRLGTLFGLED